MMNQTTTKPSRTVSIPQNAESNAWKWMRYSGFLLIPLAWGHLLLQDVIVGVHKIDTQYVADRWLNPAWRIYDVLLLTFAFAHGVNGLRQVLNDFVHTPKARQTLAWVLFAGWLVISAIGAYAIIVGVGK